MNCSIRSEVSSQQELLPYKYNWNSYVKSLGSVQTKSTVLFLAFLLYFNVLRHFQVKNMEN
jgi:hypothetical protein